MENLALSLQELNKRKLSLKPKAKTIDFVDPDPVRWIRRHFRIPETNTHRFNFHPYQEMSLRAALHRNEAGEFDYSTILWSDIKKSAKSTIAAAVMLWMAWQSEWGSVYIIANDLEGAASRVGHYITRSIELHPTMREVIRVIPSRNRIEFPNHAFIQFIPIDPSGEAGSNADAVCWSELWGAHEKANEKMWTELTLSPMKHGKSFRWVETYAGYSNESRLLENLYHTGVKEGAPIAWAGDFTPAIEAFTNPTARQFTLWNTHPRLSWQNQEYYAEQAASLDPAEFNRVHRNQWSSSRQTFVPPEWWEACKENCTPLIKNQSVILGMDAAVTGDCFGLLMVSGRGDGNYDVRYARKWTPPKGGKLDFGSEDGPESELRRLLLEYNVVEVAYDPYQLEDMASRIGGEMIGSFYAFNQGAQRAVADKALQDAIRDRHIHHNGLFHDLTEHINNANSKLDGEKLRLVKKADNMKIDLSVCLSMALERANYWGI